MPAQGRCEQKKLCLHTCDGARAGVQPAHLQQRAVDHYLDRHRDSDAFHQLGAADEQVEDHVHLLASLSRTCAAAEMVKEVKRGSSLWAKERDALMRDFGWQNGYGMFSIGASQIEDVRRYIAEQEQHHRKLSFQDEFRRLLKRYELAYDERYVWN